MIVVEAETGFFPKYCMRAFNCREKPGFFDIIGIPPEYGSSSPHRTIVSLSGGGFVFDYLHGITPSVTMQETYKESTIDL